jgi:hypothetical protein
MPFKPFGSIVPKHFFFLKNILLSNLPIMRVPDEETLFKKCVVHTKFHICVFIKQRSVLYDLISILPWKVT